MRKLMTEQQSFGGQSDPIFPHIEQVSYHKHSDRSEFLEPKTVLDAGSS
jgi:hypothetical protein